MDMKLNNDWLTTRTLPKPCNVTYKLVSKVEGTSQDAKTLVENSN